MALSSWVLALRCSLATEWDFPDTDNLYRRRRTRVVTVADLNGDGKADLVVANANCGIGNGTVSVLLGTGNGTFQTALNYTATASCLVSVVVGDFNRDGNAM